MTKALTEAQAAVATATPTEPRRVRLAFFGAFAALTALERSYRESDDDVSTVAARLEADIRVLVLPAGDDVSADGDVSGVEYITQLAADWKVMAGRE